MKPGAKIVFLTTLAVLWVLLGGCAYHAGHLKRVLPGGYDRVAIPTFGNRTKETGAEAYFTNALIQEFNRSKMASIVAKNDAQMILEGVIKEIRYVGTQVSAQDPDVQDAINKGGGSAASLPESVIFTKEYRVFVTVALVARRTSDNTVMWQSDVIGEKRYAAPLIFTESVNSANALYNSSARQQTIARMATDMMSEAHDRLTENF